MMLNGNVAKLYLLSNWIQSNYEFIFSVYGGLQEFISFSVWQNTIRYAFEAGMLNSRLSRNNWQSKFFEFFAGDLY